MHSQAKHVQETFEQQNTNSKLKPQKKETRKTNQNKTTEQRHKHDTFKTKQSVTYSLLTKQNETLCTPYSQQTKNTAKEKACTQNHTNIIKQKTITKKITKKIENDPTKPANKPTPRKPNAESGKASSLKKTSSGPKELQRDHHLIALSWSR